MKGRATRSATAAAAVDLALTATTMTPISNHERSVDSFAVISSTNQQAETNSSPEHGTSDSVSGVQISATQDTSGEQNPSTPRTPNTTPEHETNNMVNPSTPGHATAGNIHGTPGSYVTVTDGASNSRSYASLTPVNPSSVDVEVNEEVGESSAYVAYVEGNADHNSLYVAAATVSSSSTTSSNGQTLPYPLYSVGENSMYSTNSAYYATNGSSNQGIIGYAQESGVAYLVSPTNNNNVNSTNYNALEIDGHPNLSHATRISPATVQWLMNNYETAEGVSLPRSTLYNHYIRHCTDHKLDPVNAASFGKLIRSVFLGLRTRRLGTRGNSKYHYYGIRLKPDSPLNHIVEIPVHNTNGSNNHHNNGGNGTGRSTKRLKISKSEQFETSQQIGSISMGEILAVQQYLGDSSTVFDDFPTLEYSAEWPVEITEDNVIVFRTLYREHCEAILEDVINFQLSDIVRRWRIFWRSGDISPGSIETTELEQMLPYTKLQILCRIKEVQHFVQTTDYQFYQSIASILMPAVLRPIPSFMTQGIRNFAKTLEVSLSGAMTGYPDEIVSMKLNVVNALAQTLRRYTSLNHLAQAARAVLQNQSQISQMLSDLNRVDFHNVEEQASWVCGCEGDIVPELEAEFKMTLGQQQTLEQWATWLEGVVDRVLRPYLNTLKFVQVARHFILKWSFYSSLVIRDLTLRSAASFGSFHLLRLLYDEYVFFLVENRIAQVTGIVPIAVIGKKSFDASFEPSMDSADEENVQDGTKMSHYIGQPQHDESSSIIQTHTLSNGITASVNSSTNESVQASPLQSNNTDISDTNSRSQSIIKSEFKQRLKNFLIV